MSESEIQRFGPYIILDRIGDGGMAEIFLAKVQGYSGFERLFALKKIHPRFSANQTFAQMLIHEAKLAACLQHFNVVQVTDLGEIEGQVFIAMEYVRGRDLAAVLSNTYRRKERLPLNLALCVATEFLAGLDYAHRMRNSEGVPLGIIHRDISPQNILISYEGEVKVTDFGIARVVSQKEGFQLPGNLHGKFGYMSPEQVMGREIDQRSDIFSAGVVVWEMLTGRRLFRGKTHRDTVKMVVSLPIPPPSKINPEVPPAVDRICTKALSRDRSERYQTTGALLGELSRVADTLPRRAATRDLAVYMRRQFGNTTNRNRPTRSPRAETSDSHSGFNSTSGVSEVSGFSLTSGDRVPLGQILLEQGCITVDDLEISLAEQRARGGRIGELLHASGTITEADLVRALATQTDLRIITQPDLLNLPKPDRLLARFPREAAEATLLVPISVNESERKVTLVVVDPFDERAILETKVVLGVETVDVYIAPRSAVRAAIEEWYPDEVDEDVLSDEVFAEPIFVDPAPAETGPPVVLIADPDVAMITPLVERVREEDCEIIVAHEGKAARTAIRDRHPTVAFLDAALPGIDGYNLLLEIRSRSDDAAVFITSSRTDEFRQAKALELGADDFIQKPFRLEVVTSKIRREIQKRSGGRRMIAQPVRFAGVSGSLEDMTGLDIVQSLELGKKNGHVVLQYEDGREGQINLKRGDIAGCVAGALLGEEAFYHLMKPGVGLFRIEYRTSDLPTNIAKPNTYMMIEAMRRLDEAGALKSTARPALGPRNVPTISPPEPRKLNNTPLPQLAGPRSGAVKLDTLAGPRPVAKGRTFSALTDDLQLDSIKALPDSTPAGSQLAAAIDRMIAQQLNEPSTNGERPSGQYSSNEENKRLARVPLEQVASVLKQEDPPSSDDDELVDLRTLKTLK